MRILLPIIAHILGDFVFQSALIAEGKRTDPRRFLAHCLIYSLVVSVSFIWFEPIKGALFAALIIIVSHAIIDYLRNMMLTRLSNRKLDSKASDLTLFIVDQLLHVVIIAISIHLLHGPNSLGKQLLDWLSIHLSVQQLVNGSAVVLLYLICLSPSAILIKKVLALLPPQSDEKADTKAISSEEEAAGRISSSNVNIELRDDILGSGYLIGVLERVILLTLGLMGQVGAIGFVLTAKSLARFKQLEVKGFAEKYLVGTLLSMGIALFCILIGNQVLR